jgi:Xaa-Pro aminopeptidase
MAGMQDNRKTETYQGDATLAGLLKEQRSYTDLEGLKAMIGGVAAAPGGDRADDWISLVAPEPSDTTKAQLLAFRATFKPDGSPAPQTSAERVAALRAELQRQNLTGFLIGRGDEHQGEYVPKRAERLGWISGFTGSAGLAIVLLDKAAVFVDGRYTLQVREEVDTGLFEIRHLINEPAERWLRSLALHGRSGAAFRRWRRQGRRRAGRRREQSPGCSLDRPAAGADRASNHPGHALRRTVRGGEAACDGCCARGRWIRCGRHHRA